MATADTDTAVPVATDAVTGTANPSVSVATAYSAAATAATAQNIEPSISTDPASTAAADPPLPPLFEREGTASTTDPPDDVCKAKTYYIANNRSLKVLVRMAWGLRNEADDSPLFDETAEPWKDRKPKEWKSDNKELGLEIRRRWDDYIKPTSTDPDAPGPRPSGWKKDALLEWLVQNPISALGNDFTTQDADCSFIHANMARCNVTPQR
jgi:hypothetical protein